MQRKIVLASGSKTRKSALKQIGLRNFIVQESAYEEDMTLDKSPEELAKFLSLGKAQDVAADHDDAIVIAGDTFVIYNSKVIGKPKSKKEATEMLQTFSGKKIKVISGMAIIDTLNNKVINDYGIGWVKFRDLTQGEIEGYVATSEPMVSAGAFAIAGQGAVLVESVEGDIYSINTIPLAKLYLGLRELGVDVFKNS